MKHRLCRLVRSQHYLRMKWHHSIVTQWLLGYHATSYQTKIPFESGELMEKQMIKLSYRCQDGSATTQMQ